MNMTDIAMELFKNKIEDLADKLYSTQEQNIYSAAEICAETIRNNGVIHVFGSGHSVGFGIEMSGRTGCLAPVHTIETTDFVLKGKVSLETFRDQDIVFERTPDIADQLYGLYDIHKDDCFIIISNSGINGVVIDMAITAKQRGHKVIIITSWKHTNAEPSRHPSGKKLYEFGDVVIDNCSPQGDALIETDGVEKVCSVSAIMCALIAQSLTMNTCSILDESGDDVPLFAENETEEGKKHNALLKKKYEGRI
ncbi:MAG: sugar isomerase domain-containing protein [Erysipelotrichia bacterium]|nr:sugar isomerase domain-containing protein [Erysipelotrichia bacterium]